MAARSLPATPSYELSGAVVDSGDRVYALVHGRLVRGERVLITGASGGVGHIAVQLARHVGATAVETGAIYFVVEPTSRD